MPNFIDENHDRGTAKHEGANPHEWLNETLTMETQGEPRCSNRSFSPSAEGGIDTR
jgi:hypothetical protein